MQPAQAMVERAVWGQPTVENIGQHALWGLSPASDVLAPLPTCVEDDPKVPIRVLLASPGDIRHILRTLSERRGRAIRFYIHEPSVEVHARHLVLLRVALDVELPIKQRASAWLEIFGNSMIQERTERYVARLAEELVDLVTGTGDSLTADAVDLSCLKFRERDVLCDAFRAWRTSPFPLKDLWDRRLRETLGLRYDSRDTAFDWDYRLGLEPAGAGIVHVRQYKNWRETGVAFEFGDQEYIKPNRTLATFSVAIMRSGKDRGQKREVRGYWGDVVVGPYVAVGVEADTTHDENAELFFEIVDKGHGTQRYRHNATEIAVYNVLSFLWRIETGRRYQTAAPHKVYSGLGADSVPDDPGARARQARHQALERATSILDAFDGISIVPICGDLDQALRKPYLGGGGGSFDVAFLGINATNAIESSALKALLKPGALIYAETAKYLLPLKKEQRTLFVRKIHAMATEMQYTPRYLTEPAPARDADETIAEYVGDCATTPSDLETAIMSFVVKPPPPPPPPGGGGTERLTTDTQLNNK
ncbi:hypothetical protein CTAYLR_005006 [Chrysophaeum taylorii]|uniref:Dynein assembly factor 3, axonemal n=1 Tax=Chrysophaeum taylorii TaxID=2483200 RepID=A0AAD7UBT0_9STRA|nr:hypothetical protein CTAYLR_005006 [Chrysophaeum taylorii]